MISEREYYLHHLVKIRNANEKDMDTVYYFIRGFLYLHLLI